MQLSVLFHKKGFQVSFMAVLAYVLLTYLFYVFKLWGYDVSDMYHPAVLSALNSDAEFSWFFMMYYPFIVVLPAGFLYMADRDTSMYIIIQAQQSKRDYYIAKYVAAFSGGFMTFTVPFFIGLLLNVLTFPLEATGTLTNFEIYSRTYYMYADSYLFSDLYLSNIYLYCIVTILIFGVFSGVISVFLVAVSTFRIKYRIFMFLPFYLIIYCIRQMGDWFHEQAIEYNYEWYLLAYDAVPNKKFIFLLGMMGFMMICTIGILIKNIKRDQLLS